MCAWKSTAIAAILASLALLGVWASQVPAPRAEAQPSPSDSQTTMFQIVGQIGGPTEAVAVQGSYAYVGVGLRLVVLNVSNPASPREVGATRPFPHFVEGVAVSGTLAYAAAGGSGLRVVDVSNPASPTEIGAWDSPGYAQGLAISGTIIYLADGPYGLRVIDVSNPARPAEIGSAYPMNYAFDLALAGRYAYVAAAGAGLLVADVSDPAHPVEIGSLDTPGYAYGLAVAANKVYMADGWGGLRVLDVSDPASPREVAAFDTSGWAFDVVVKDAAAYVADGWRGILVLNVTDPANPALVGSYQPTGGHAADIAVSGGTLYVADRTNGLRLLDLSAPSQPAQVGFHGPMGFADDVVVSGNYAYVAAGPYGLRVVDISDPARPREVGVYATPGYAWSVAVDGSYAYVGSVQTDVDPGGLLVVDISDPTRPTKATYFRPEHDRPRNMVIKGGVLYAVDEWGLQLIDISNPRAPAQLSFIQLAGPTGLPDTVGIAVSGTVAYVAQSEDGLKVVDVTDPRNPALIGAYKSPDILKVMSVAVVGELAYVGNNGRLQLVDVSDPRDPKGLGFYGIPGVIDAILPVGDSELYLASGAPGVRVVDISSPRAPALAGSLYVPGYTAGLAIGGNHVYVAAEDGGLFILQRAGGAGTATTRFPQEIRSQRGPGRAAAVSSRLIAYQATQGDPVLPVAMPIGNQVRAPSHPQPQGREALAAGYSHLDGALTLASGRVLTVTSTADSGTGTLRQAMTDAVSGDTITFDPAVFPPQSPVTITLASGLLVLSQGNVTIDGSNTGVILDGSSTPTGTIALSVYSDRNVVKGLQIVNFPQGGILISNGAYNIIGGDRTRGSAPLGEGNLISGSVDGVVITGNAATGNRISGNNIGTDLTGMVARGNTNHGVFISGAASQNLIGGATPGERNIISGNGQAGVMILAEGTINNRVSGNYIGLDGSGNRTLPGHVQSAVIINNGASHNTIGGSTPGERNVISGGGRTEVGLGPRAHHNTITGNYIGTDAAGAVNLGIATSSVSLALGAFSNAIQGNVISTNGISGILISDWGSSGNEVIGNFIGVNATGTASLVGSGDGVHVNAPFNKIGGTTAPERNIISGNGGNGIKIGFHSMGDVVAIGNFIGTDVSGSKAIGNGSSGILVTESTYHSFIGGTTPGERNVISGNSGDGIGLSGVGAQYNFIGGNYIGTDAEAQSALSNQGRGVNIYGAVHTFVQSNTIAHNSEAGVQVGASPYNTIRRNSIHSNTAKGIETSTLAAPVITAVTTSGVSGTACPGCTVEVFSDAEDEGRVYEGSTVAAPSGLFNFTKGTPLAGPNVTATATDGDGNTSEFSTAQKVWRRTYLPAVMNGP